jgi:nitrite reductase/ring-hydroxylating ferredoxin subunit
VANAPLDPKRPLDVQINSPEREGLTGTAPANLYTPVASRDQLTIAPDFLPPEVQPAWRQDFPIDWPEDHYVERRDFMKFLVLTSLAMTVGQFWIAAQHWLRDFSGPAPGQRLASIDDIAVGGTLTFTYPGTHDPCVIVRVASTEFVAYSQKCTHLSCAVIPRPSEGVLHCPCHNGFFDLRDGHPIAGPPQRPLPRVRLEIRGREIFAVGLDVRTV